MNVINLLALIFSILILGKIILIFIYPKFWIKAAEKLTKDLTIMSIVYLLLVIVIGYYLSLNLTIFQIAAVMFFTSLLFGISLVPYYKQIIKINKQAINRRYIWKKFWLTILIWLVIAIVVLVKLFY